MINNKKKSVESTLPLPIHTLPKHKRKIRPMTHLTSPNRSFKENHPLLNRSSQANIAKQAHHSCRSRNLQHKTLLIGSNQTSIKPSNVAFFNFFTDLENDFVISSAKSKNRCKSSSKHRADSEFLKRFKQNKPTEVKSEGKKIEYEGLSMVKVEEEIEIDFIHKEWTATVEESGEEESPLRDYSNMLKPRFNSLY